jgi:hypothetical protein
MSVEALPFYWPALPYLFARYLSVSLPDGRKGRPVKRGGPLKRYTPLRAKRAFKKTRRKAENVRNLKNKLWKLFSEYIRRRNADEVGNAHCVTCGKVAPWRQLQAGHYVRASAGLATYFDERNVNNQCVGCNIFLNGNMDRYALFMLKTYGATILDELDALRRTTRQIKGPEYLELIERYKSKLEALGRKEAA